VPTKLLEYLALGVRPIASCLPAVQSLGWPGVAYFDDDPVASVLGALEHGPPSPADAQWAAAQTWDRRFAELQGAIADRGAGFPADWKCG
jgi:hypothetical protein